tara:strand:+ start:282 stop:686 length:405 start_codon:yes stop_codon:yes gene_type:complete
MALVSRALLVLANDTIRSKAADWCRRLPAGTRLEFKKPKRTLDQNAKMWAMLTEISEQLSWHGVRLSTEDWKLVLLDGLKREMRLVPNIDGTGFVNLGRSSSDLSKQEFVDLIELIAAFGAQHGVVFSDESKAA